jgi:hypothetical protein
MGGAPYTASQAGIPTGGSIGMGTALIWVLISIWLGMAAAMIIVLQVSYSRRKHAITDKERFMH